MYASSISRVAGSSRCTSASASARSPSERAKTSSCTASSPSHAASSPNAARRATSAWNSRSWPCTNPSPYHASRSERARTWGTPSSSRPIHVGAATRASVCPSRVGYDRPMAASFPNAHAASAPNHIATPQDDAERKRTPP